MWRGFFSGAYFFKHIFSPMLEKALQKPPPQFWISNILKGGRFLKIPISIHYYEYSKRNRNILQENQLEYVFSCTILMKNGCQNIILVKGIVSRENAQQNLVLCAPCFLHWPLPKLEEQNKIKESAEFLKTSRGSKTGLEPSIWG